MPGARVVSTVTATEPMLARRPAMVSMVARMNRSTKRGSPPPGPPFMITA